jgi:hypothetical protein
MSGFPNHSVKHLVQLSQNKTRKASFFMQNLNLSHLNQSGVPSKMLWRAHCTDEDIEQCQS